MVSVSRNFCPWLCFLLYTPSMDNLIYYHFLYQVLIACPIFSPSVLKTQKTADPIYLFDFPEPQILSDCKLNTSSSHNKSFILCFVVHLSKWNQSSPRHSHRVWGSSVEWSSLTHYNQSFTMSWLFHQLKSSPQFSLYISVISVLEPHFLSTTKAFLQSYY